MNRRHILMKVSFVLLLLLAALHTSFIIMGGPPMPETTDFLKMVELMNTLEIDAGGGIMRTMQNFMDGFNIIVSIFLFSLPVMGWYTFQLSRHDARKLRRTTLLIFLPTLAFFGTSLTLLAIGGTVVSGVVCLLLLISFFQTNTQKG